MKYPVVIFCGGKGTRMSQVTGDLPKPLVEINGIPLISHIMDSFMRYGFNEFILCLGYKSLKIKEYFLHEMYYRNDFTMDSSGNIEVYHQEDEIRKITMVDTGLDSMTGARLNRIRKYITTDHFLATYGDGLSDINVQRLVEFHLTHGKIGTVTGINPISQYGHIEYEGNLVKKFTEKPKMNHRINGGFFVFQKNIFQYLSSRPDCVLEREPLERLASDSQLMMFEHNGFWKSVDTVKDQFELEQILGKESHKEVNTNNEHLILL